MNKVHVYMRQPTPIKTLVLLTWNLVQFFFNVWFSCLLHQKREFTIENLVGMVDAAVNVASAMVRSYKEEQLFQLDRYILYYCCLMFSHAYLTISTLVIVAININQCGICNNNKPHRRITIWIWYKHSMLLLSIVYSCTCITISTFGDCSHQ